MFTLKKRISVAIVSIAFCLPALVSATDHNSTSEPLATSSTFQTFGGMPSPPPSVQQKFDGETVAPAVTQKFIGTEAPVPKLSQKFGGGTAPVPKVDQKFGEGYDSAKGAGTTATAPVLEKFGTRDALNKNISSPMTDSKTQLKTTDGSTSFSGVTGAPSSAPFLQVFMQPSNSGDLDILNIGQDLQGKGTLTRTIDLASLGFRVSGVCSNGFISCDAGKWTNCKPFAWKSDQNGSLSISQTSLTKLGGCYCINASCGSTLAWTNGDLILKDLGGGAVGAIHANDASTIITSITSDPITTTYYGRLVKKDKAANAAEVPAISALPSAQPQQAYFANAGSLSADSSNVPANYGSNKDSLYYKVSNSARAMGNAKVQSCTIKRNARIVTTSAGSFTGGGTDAQLCTDHLVWMKIKKTGNQQFDLLFVDSGPGGLGSMHHNCGGQPGRAAEADGWYLEKRINLPADTGSTQNILVKAEYAMSNIHGDGCISGGAGAMNAVGVNGELFFDTPVATSAPCPAGGAQSPYYDWHYQFEYATDTFEEPIDDLCAGLAMKSECALQEEVSDGVQTKRDFHSTGLMPLASVRDFKGAGPIMSMVRPWWLKTRKYVCIDKQGYDFSGVEERFYKVQSTSKNNVKTLGYQDQVQTASGQWSAKTAQIQLPDSTGVTGECEYVCKIKLAVADTQVGLEGVMADQRLGDSKNTTTNEVYKTCIDNGTTCPVDTAAGETKIQDCGCPNDFGLAASTMQLLRLGGADQICSTGVATPPASPTNQAN